MTETRPKYTVTKGVHTRRALTSDELSNVLAQASRLGTTPYTVILLAARTGLRVSEISNLKQSAVVVAGHIVETITIDAETAKGGQGRNIPLDQLMREQLRECNRKWLVGGLGENANDRFFSNRTGSGPLNERNMQRWYKACAEKAGITGTTFHSLRHTFANQLRRVTDLPTLQYLLGHKHLSSTQVYTHPDSEDASKAIARAFS